MYEDEASDLIKSPLTFSKQNTRKFHHPVEFLYLNVPFFIDTDCKVHAQSLVLKPNSTVACQALRKCNVIKRGL